MSCYGEGALWPEFWCRCSHRQQESSDSECAPTLPTWAPSVVPRSLEGLWLSSTGEEMAEITWGG